MIRVALLIATCILLTDFATSHSHHDHHGHPDHPGHHNHTTPFTVPPRSDNKTGTYPPASTATPGPNEGDVRLVGGNFYNEGRVEMYKEGQWGSVCDWSVSTSDANVICRQLGFRDGGNPALWTFGQGNGTIAMKNPECNGYETRLEDCSSYSDYCDHDDDIGVICSTYEPEPTSSSDSYQYFLMSTNTEANQGVVIVSVNYGEEWGIICDIDDVAARAICSDLGYGTENAYSLWISDNGFQYPAVVDRLYCPSYYDDNWDWYSINDCEVRPAVNGTCSFEYGNKGVSCNPLGYWHGIPHHIVMAVSIAFSVAIFLIVVLAITACCCCCCCRKPKTKVITTSVPAPRPVPTPEPTKVGVYIPIHEAKVPIDEADSVYA